MFWFFISHCNKVIRDFVFIIFGNLWQCTVQYVPKHCLRLLPHVSRAHRTLNYSNISFTFWDMTSNAMKISEKTWKCTVITKFKSFFQLFYLLRLSLSNPLLGFYSKKTINVNFLFFKKYQKTFFYIKIICLLKLSELKKFENFWFFFFTV